MGRPKFSIITVCLNAVTTIEECINSVAIQSYRNFEYIIVDGQSTDGTLKILDKYKTHYSRFISEKDGGIYHAMNKAINLASGDYLFFLNADDSLINTNVLEDVATEIAKKLSDIYYGNIILTYTPSLKEAFRPPLPSELPSYLSTCCLPHQAMFATRSLFQEIGLFDTSYKILADYEWYLRAYFRNKKFSYIPVDVSYYSFQGISSNPKIRFPDLFLAQNKLAAEQPQEYNLKRLITYRDYLNKLDINNKYGFYEASINYEWTIEENLLLLQDKILSLECLIYAERSNACSINEV